MPAHIHKLSRLQLTDALAKFPAPAVAPVPAGGWSRAIREALGLTQVQLAGRLKISRQSLQDLERAEGERRVTLESLDRLANAMGCRVVYAIVPQEGTLDDIRLRQARRLADEMMKPSAHSMSLEQQGVPEAGRARHRDLLVEELLNGSSRKLWR